MKLDYQVNPYIPVTKQRHLVYALIEVDPDDAQASAPAPLNLGLVVDASRSMSIPILTDTQFAELRRKGMARQITVDGVRVWQIEVPKNTTVDAPGNMEFTKQALAVVADYLQPTDRFSLVAFAQDALLMVRNTPGTQKNLLLEAVDRLDKIDLGDETYMARGMEKGYEQVLPGLSPDRVSRLIVLTDGYTKEEHACYEWTRAAKQKGIVVSTMGLGLDFNEELLISLADVSGGNAYFIDEPRDIPDAFRQELSEIKSVTWRDLSLSLTLPADITLRRAHRVVPTLTALEAQHDRIALGDLQANQPPSVLLELVVPPRPAGNYRLTQVTLHGRPAGSQQTEPIATQDVLICYTERPSQAKQTNTHLMSAVQKVSAFKLQNQAIEEASRGNVAGATRRLRMAGERLLEMGQEDLGQTMLVEAELMEKEGQMSAEGTKKLRYGTRKLSRDRQ
jgi:hypothetical protein